MRVEKPATTEEAIFWFFAIALGSAYIYPKSKKKPNAMLNYGNVKVRLVGLWKRDGKLYAFICRPKGAKDWPFFAAETEVPFEELS